MPGASDWQSACLWGLSYWITGATMEKKSLGHYILSSRSLFWGINRSVLSPSSTLQSAIKPPRWVSSRFTAATVPVGTWCLWPCPKSSLGLRVPPAHPGMYQAGIRQRERHEGSHNSGQALSLSPECLGLRCSSSDQGSRGVQIHPYAPTALSLLRTDALHKDGSYRRSCNTTEAHYSTAVNVLVENQNGCSCFSSSLHPIKNMGHLHHWGANNHFC